MTNKTVGLVAIVALLATTTIACSYWSSWGVAKTTNSLGCVIVDVQVQGEYSLPVRRAVLLAGSDQIVWDAHAKTEEPLHIRTAEFCVGMHDASTILSGNLANVEYGPAGATQVLLAPDVPYRLEMDVVSRWRNLVVEFSISKPEPAHDGQVTTGQS